MLAQDWLSGVNRIKTEYDGWMEARLRLPDKFDPDATPSCLANVAERIVFTDDIPSLLYEMHRNKQITYEGMFSTTRLPFDCFWIEYKTVALGVELAEKVTSLSYGALVQRHGDTVRMVVVLGFKTEFAKHPICAVTHAIQFDEWPIKIRQSQNDPNKHAIKFAVCWKLPETDYDMGNGTFTLITPTHANGLGGIMAELIFGIFLVTQPKVYSEEVVRWDARKQIARVRSGDKPLLEYRKINLRICKDAKRYTHSNGGVRRVSTLTDDGDTESPEAIRHRRYHKVMGHFRHYQHSSPPHTTWIEPFYRGDPSLGVTFTERDVTK